MILLKKWLGDLLNTLKSEKGSYIGIGIRASGLFKVKNSAVILFIRKTMVLMLLSLTFLAWKILKIFTQINNRRRNAIIAFSLCL